MIPIITLLLVLYVSLFVTRIATIALVHTGMSKEAARLQARSALTGTGFTTAESELMVNHPVRRRILMLLMLCGSVGIVATMSTIILGFVKTDNGTVYDSLWLKLAILVPGLAVLWVLTNSKWFEKKLDQLFDRLLAKYTNLEVSDFVHVCHLADNYKIAEIYIAEKHRLVGKSLKTSQLTKHGLNVLGIQKPDGNYIGVPTGETTIEARDVLVIYGSKDNIGNFSKEALSAQEKTEKATAQSTP
jgi:K+/H+ antiporter YhaU regulatory subunit KhtT